MRRQKASSTPMSDLHQEVRDGRAAQELLENPVLLSYFDSVRANLLGEIGSNANLPAASVKDLQMWLIHLNRFEQHLRTYVETGEMASIQLNQEAA